jgi:hypothetical protein
MPTGFTGKRIRNGGWIGENGPDLLAAEKEKPLDFRLLSMPESPF